MATEMRPVPFIVVEGDEQLPLEAIARAKEMHDRVCRFGYWLHEGYIAAFFVVSKMVIRVTVADDVIEEPAEQFPTANLMARIALAIRAGVAYPRQYTGGGEITDGPVAPNFYVLEQGYQNVANLTRSHRLPPPGYVLDQGYQNVAKLTQSYRDGSKGE